MRQGLALALGCLIGTAGLGGLTASAFLALEAPLGTGTAALLTGLALSILAGGVLARGRPSTTSACRRGTAPTDDKGARPSPPMPRSSLPSPRPSCWRAT